MKTMQFKTSFSDYDLVQTNDGSWAIYSNFYDENSHSLAGASSETYYNFIEGCKLGALFKSESSPCILEVGFGIGNGFANTFKFWSESESKPDSLVFFSMEIDPELVTYAIEKGPYAESFSMFHRNDKFNWVYEENGKRIELIALTGDGRDSVKTIKENSIHAIFQDAYSPGKNPSLWTLEWFCDLYRVGHERCLMTTYSASARIRRSMVEAKWNVSNRKGFQNKRSMSIASKGVLEDAINEKVLSANLTPLKDEDLSESKDEK